MRKKGANILRIFDGNNIKANQTLEWKEISHGSGICRFSINQRREMHSIWKFRQILDICRLV